MTKELNQRAVRFSTAPWYTPGLECIIIGLGGIGSYLSYFLGRQDCELHLFDFDTIENTNLGGQLFSSEQNNISKAEACKSNILKYSDNTEVTIYSKYEKDSLSSDYMFVCPDNMEARINAFNNWEKNNSDGIFIEGSMTAENFRVHFITKDRIQRYKEYLYSDIKIEPLPCNFKSTSHCGAICAGLMVSGFNNFITNKNLQEDIRDIPYCISVSLASFSFDYEY
jgi:molybdopterin/thiamine biosynthesis adenylyltransferase